MKDETVHTSLSTIV